MLSTRLKTAPTPNHRYNFYKRVLTVLKMLPSASEQDLQKVFCPRRKRALNSPSKSTTNSYKRQSTEAPLPSLLDSQRSLAPLASLPTQPSLPPSPSPLTQLTPATQPPSPAPSATDSLLLSAADADEPYTGYCVGRDQQSLPPDPPPLGHPSCTPFSQTTSLSSLAPTPPDTTPATPPRAAKLLSPRAQAPFEQEYASISDKVLLNMSDNDYVITQSSSNGKPPLPPSSQDYIPLSPAPALPNTPSMTYSSTYTPVDRNYSMDYEAVMVALGDVNRFGRVLFRNGVRTELVRDEYNVPTTREDVVEVLVELRDMLDRMFNRMSNRVRDV